MNRRWLTAGALALSVALAGGGVALSQVDKGGSSGRKTKQFENAFKASLARELGVSEATLDAALKAAKLKTIDDAVKAGVLTAEQAAQLKERISSGELGGFGLGLGRFKNRELRADGRIGGKHRAVRVIAADERARTAIGDAIAKALGTTRDGLATQLREGKEFEALMKAKGLTAEKLGALVAAAAKPHLDRLVDAGTIDRASADEVQAFLARGGMIGKLVRLSIFATR